MKVILACRNPELGTTAASSLVALGFDCEYRNCDISSISSIESFGLQSDYDHVDILVNNAAMAFKNVDHTPFEQQGEPTMAVNFFGTLNVTLAMLPLLRASISPRIINMASQAGALKTITSPSRRGLFFNPGLTLVELEQFVRDFVAASKVGPQLLASRGWPPTCYGMSKLAVIALTKVLSRQEPSIIVVACCPGWCATDMSSHSGPYTAEQGARTPAYLAMLANLDVSKSGFFFKEGAPIDW